MKMLILVYSQFLTEDVHAVLKRLDVKGYTEVPKVFGMGELGRAEDSRYAPGHNLCIFAALPDDDIPPLVDAFKALSEGKKKEYGKPAALHAFVTNCLQAI